ncbi:hypothetical protein [Solimonas flava]|uniref:hypothetical protein n=1 Tax=Solimonas flava TaxID=415849 RepID=UPI0012B57526|nr:hypothetical protein [Solimonas flava]
MTPAPRLGLDTCEELLGKLRWEKDLLEKQWDSPYLAFNFAVTANHLFADWIKSVGNKTQRQRANRLPELAKKLFFAWRDVANASKHWSLDSNARKKQIVSSVSGPVIGDWYAYLIAGPVIYLEIEGARPSLPELVSVTLQCFEWILESTENEFPIELTRGLNSVFRSLSKE